MDLSFSPAEERFRTELRAWLASHPPGVAPEPLQVEPLSQAAPEFVPVDISAIAVPAIVIEPLPRSMP